MSAYAYAYAFIQTYLRFKSPLPRDDASSASRSLGFHGAPGGEDFCEKRRVVWDAWIYTFCMEMMLRGVCIDIWVCYGELGAFVLKTVFG